jgi:iduronate 2-sulfatase
MGYSLRTDQYRYNEWRKFDTKELLARELYDHVNDPLETANLADLPLFDNVVSSLSLQLQELIK